MSEDLTELGLAVITLLALEIWVISNNLLVSFLKSVSDSKSQDFSVGSTLDPTSQSDQRRINVV